MWRLQWSVEKTHFFSFLKIIIYLFLAVLGLPAARAFLVAQLVKNPPAMQETWVRFLGQEDPLEEEMAITSVSLPGESHGQRSLEGYSP